MEFTQTKLKIIVTGTGRCGTLYLSKLLSFCNIFCGHETIFDYSSWNTILQRIFNNKKLNLSKIATDTYGDYLIDKNIEADSSYMAMPYLNLNIFDSCKFIHLIRHPENVINSFCHYLNYFYDEAFMSLNEFDRKYLNFINKHVPDIKKYKNPYDRAAYYYLYWNNEIEQKLKNKNKILLKIEEICNNSLLEEFIGIKVPDDFENISVNKNKKNKFKLSHIRNKNIKEQIVWFCEKYKYNFI